MEEEDLCELIHINGIPEDEEIIFKSHDRIVTKITVKNTFRSIPVTEMWFLTVYRRPHCGKTFVKIGTLEIAPDDSVVDDLSRIKQFWRGGR